MKEFTDDDRAEYLIDKMLTVIGIAGDYSANFGEDIPYFSELENEYLLLRSIFFNYWPCLCTPENFSDDFQSEIKDHIWDTYTHSVFYEIYPETLPTDEK